MASEWRDTVYGAFAADFVESRLRDLCEPEAGIQTGPFGSQLHQEDYVSIGTPIITVEHLGENRIFHDGLPRVSDSDRNRLSRYWLRVGDIVFSRVGSVDRRALVRSAEDGWMFSGRCLRVRPNREKIDSEYLSYFFGLPAFKEQIRAVAVGATMPSINTAILSDVVVVHPKDLVKQRAIAHILGTLDDKIELNRKQSETLEAMARTLFKAWFVDFEPVRAKMDGRWQRGQSLLGLPAHLYDLFPDRIKESELGEIPEGWRVASLPDLVEINPPRPLRKGEIAPYLDMANMPTRGHAPIEISERAFASGMRFMNGDTLVARITPCLENGKTAFVDFLQDGQIGWGSTEYIVLHPRAPLPEEFAYCLARSDAFRDFAIQSMTGTSGRQRVQVDSLAHFQLPQGPALVAELFGRAIKPLFARSSAAVRESRTLAQLRDTLLPKLISGELRVKDAEAFLKERGL